MIILHDRTRSLLENAVSAPSQAYLISGPSGAGKLHIARVFAGQKLNVQEDFLDKQPYFKIISPEKNTITIGQIRELHKFLQLKTLGKNQTKRAIVIENAHLMTNEAQNALLKALEEPPGDTVIILTAPKTLALRETIYSRVQQIPILPVTKQTAQEYFGSSFDKEQIEKAFALSSGNVGFMHALLNDENHELVTQIELAKEILAGSVFERLVKVDALSKQKEQLPDLLYAFKLICTGALNRVGQKGDKKSLKQWHRRLGVVHEAEASLTHNPNAKLLLTNTFMRL